MIDKARELLERVLDGMDEYGDINYRTLNEIRAYLAEPEKKQEPLNEETIKWEYEKTEKGNGIVTLTEYGWFDVGARFAEKHHGIEGKDD